MAKEIQQPHNSDIDHKQWHYGTYNTQHTINMKYTHNRDNYFRM